MQSFDAHMFESECTMQPLDAHIIDSESVMQPFDDHILMFLRVPWSHLMLVYLA